MKKSPKVLIVLTLLVVTGCGTETVELPELRVCVRPNPGFFEKTPSASAGLEVDLLSSFAEEQGVAMEVTWLDSFGELIPAVVEGRCDIGSAGVMITEERARVVDFSEPYFPVRVVLVGSPSSDYPSLESLDSARVAVVTGTVHEQYARSHGVSAIVGVSEDAELFTGLMQGQADLAICDSAIVLPFLEKYSELQILDSLSDRSFFAFALAKGSVWREPLSQHIRAFESSGAYRASLVEHFGEAAADYLLDEE